IRNEPRLRGSNGDALLLSLHAAGKSASSARAGDAVGGAHRSRGAPFPTGRCRAHRTPRRLLVLRSQPLLTVAATRPEVVSTSRCVPADTKSRCTYPSAIGPSRGERAALVIHPI